MSEELSNAASPEASNPDPIAAPAVVDTSVNNIDKAVVPEVAVVNPVDASAPAVEAPKEEVKAVEYPEDWREKYAADNEKILNQLKRYDSPKAALDALFAAQKKISETRPTFQLPENPTPEDIAKYREENSIPAKPEDYDVTLADGYVIGDMDKPMIEEYKKIAHERNFRPDEVKKSVQAYFEIQAKEQEGANKFYQEQKAAADAELQKEWGKDTNSFKNRIANFLDNNFGRESAKLLDSAILPDGTTIATNPKLVKQFLALANSVNSAITITPNNNEGQSIDKEIQELTQMIRTDRDGYFADKSKPARLNELLATKERLEAASKRA